MLLWNASDFTDAEISYSCPSDSIQFYSTEVENSPGKLFDCSKTVLKSYSNVRGANVTVHPFNFKQNATIPITLTLMKNGVPTGTKKTVSFTFIADTKLTPALTIIDPAEAVTLTRSAKATISWFSEFSPVSALVYVDLIGYSKSYHVAENWPNTGSNGFIVGLDIKGTTIPSGAYILKVCVQATVSGSQACDVHGGIRVSDK